MIKFEPDSEIYIAKCNSSKKLVKAMSCPIAGLDKYEFFITDSVDSVIGFTVTEKTTGFSCIGHNFLIGANYLGVEEAYYLACFILLSVGKESFEIALKKVLNAQI